MGETLGDRVTVVAGDESRNAHAPESVTTGWTKQPNRTERRTEHGSD